MANSPVQIWWTIVQTGDLGGDHFIAICTGLNLAFLGLKDYRERIRYAERQLEGKVRSYRATIADASAPHFLKITGGFQRKLCFLRDWGWRFFYALAVLSALAGMLMLYFGCQAKSSWILLLPTLLQILIPSGTLLLFVGWLKLMRRGMSFFFPQDISLAVAQFSEKTTEKLTKSDQPPAA